MKKVSFLSMFRVAEKSVCKTFSQAKSGKLKQAKPTSYTTTGSNQVYRQNVTYLPSKVRGQHYYLYVIEDIYSRKIVGYEVYEHECGELASQLLQRTLMREQCFNRPAGT
ncbi:transposase [Vibrio crassostreae]|nr:transposase [Vibrio crassostreae]CAK2820975.1 transposase [Vibrio crassostreae]CAK2905815.1 transposase [Vibrio crassostreae]CAK3574782.1 transposase [Vibrio crassostreae]